MKIQILGTGCPKCIKLEQNTRKAVEQLDIQCEIEKVTDINKIMEFEIMLTPGLAIDKQVVSVGKVLNIEQIKDLIKMNGN
ncbi:MAG: redox-active disulfide protein 2 [Desulfuromonas sp. SDB]|nr:MAG: redox-active disulfide protein 2 [Desulfuromonas sp. SDB]